MISFRFIVLIFLFLLLGLKIRFWNKSRPDTPYLDAAIFFWVILIFFFFDAVIEKKYLIPGDILLNFYPWKALAEGQIPHNPLLSDITGCVYPWMAAIKKSLLQFDFPLWNPYAYSGSPLAGNQVSAAFHPFNLLLYFMPVPDAATLFPFLRLFIAGMGGFALLKSWKLSSSASLLGSTLFCFCGVHISWLSNYPEISVTMLIPWIFLSIDKIACQGSMKWWVVLVLLSVVQFLGGHCETSFHLYAWAIPFFFFSLYRGKTQNSIDMKIMLSRTGLFVLAGIFSLGISAFQLFPFLEYLPLSTRMQAISAMDANLFLGLDFFKVFTTVTATLLTPDFFGNPVAGNYWGDFNFIEQNTHITVTGLFFALMAFTRNKSENTTNSIKHFFLWAGLIAFLIAVRTPGLFDFIVSFPLFKQNSNHRLIIIFSFAFSILAAFAANDIQAFGLSSKKKFYMIAAGFLVMAFLLSGFDVSALTREQFQYRWAHVCYFLLFLSACFLLFYFCARHRVIRRHIPIMATGLVLIEVFVWGANFNTFVTRENIFPSTPLTDFIQSRQGIFRVASPSGVLPTGTEQMFEFDSITGLDPMKSHTYERIYSRMTGKYNSIHTGAIHSFDSPWINFLNVRYVAAPPGTKKEQLNNKDLVLVYQGRDGVVFKNPNAFERVFRVDKIVAAADSEQAFELVQQNEDLLDRIAVVEGDHKLFDHQSLDSGTIGSRHPKILEKKNNYMRLDFKGLPQGFYVAGKQYYPGWKLKIDGRPARVVRTNYAFMGFGVPEDTNIVELYYDPLSFKAGLWVSTIFSGFLFLWMGLWNKFRTKRLNHRGYDRGKIDLDN